MTRHVGSMAASPVYRTFGSAKCKWNPACADCEFLPSVSGDCLKHRRRWGDGQSTLSVLCEGWKMFYRETLPHFKNWPGVFLEKTAGGLLPRGPTTTCATAEAAGSTKTATGPRAVLTGVPPGRALPGKVNFVRIDHDG
jgi:hypothetical protein